MHNSVFKALHQQCLHQVPSGGKSSCFDRFLLPHHYTRVTAAEWSAVTSSTSDAATRTALSFILGSLLSVFRSPSSINFSQFQQDEVDPDKRGLPTLPLEPKTSRASDADRDGKDKQPAPSPTSQSISSSTPPTHGTDTGIGQIQCPAWNDGYCPRGRYCKMLHIHRVILPYIHALKRSTYTTENRLRDGEWKQHMQQPRQSIY